MKRQCTSSDGASGDADDEGRTRAAVGESRVGRRADGGPRASASARLLARYLSRYPEAVRGKRVVDVCAGCGAAGLAAASLGAASVSLLDAAARLPHLEKRAAAYRTGAARARTHVAAEALDWAALPELRADVVLVANGVGEPQIFQPLAAALAALLGRGAVGLLAYEQRTVDCEPFFSRLHSAKTDARLVASESLPDRGPTLFLYELRRKS